MSQSIKLYGGVKVITSDEIIKLKYIPDLWDMFKWDIKNDPMAKECSIEITRQLIGFGRCDLSQATQNGNTLIVELLPSDYEWKDEEVEK